MAHPPASAPTRQLPLPLPSTAPVTPMLPPDLATLRADQVWRTLPDATRAATRHAFRRILKEVIDDADQQR